MCKTNSTLILLISASLIAACDSGNNVSSSSDNAQKLSVNPLINGNVPEKQETIQFLTVDGLVNLTLDPTTNSFRYVDPTRTDASGKTGVIEGTYDPATGALENKSCTGSLSFCNFGNYSPVPKNIKEVFEVAKGDGRVLITDNFNDSTDFGQIIGYNPTQSANMPQGNKVIYKGDMVGTVRLTDWNSSRDAIATGQATSTADFDNSQLTVKFSDLENSVGIQSAEIRNINIEGSTFSDGDLRVTTDQGNKFTTYDDSLVLSGQFFGDAGEELGGTIFTEGGSLIMTEEQEETWPDFQFSVGWTGVKQ